MQHSTMQQPLQSKTNTIECVLVFVLLSSTMHIKWQKLLLSQTSFDHTTCDQTSRRLPAVRLYWLAEMKATKKCE